MSIYQEEEYQKRFDFSLWKKLFRYFKAYKKELGTLVAVMIIVGAIDTAFPLITRYAIDRFIVPGTLEGIWPFALLFLGLIIVQGFNIFLLIATAGRIDMVICYDIRRDGFKRLQELSFSYFDRTPVGWLVARMTSDVGKLGDVIAWGLVDLIWGTTMMVGITAVMFVLDWRLALIVYTVIPVLVVASGLFQKIILKAVRQIRKVNSKITGAFNEGILGARTTKTLVREPENLREFKLDTASMYRSSVRAAVYSSIYLPLVLVLGSIGTALVLWYGGNRVLSATMTYGTLVAFISYTVQFFEPIRELARIFSELQSAQASGERILSLVDRKPEIQDSREVLEKYGSMDKKGRDRWPKIKGNIEFRNVSFAYKDGEAVLKDFNLKVSAGEKIALVGETGAGKSTIVNLACRFYEPVKGEIYIDGVEYRRRPLLWLHANLGYVLQAPHLFSGTLMENIRYGRLEATDEEVIDASKLVRAHDFIMRFKKGYDTQVGEGGGRISIGEKQLISFARAILASPSIFVLDEATSSVDTETEKVIQDAISTVLHGRTSFIIAHRLSTIRSADRILVVQQGGIIEEGNHQELMGKKGHYYSMYTKQFMEEAEMRMLRA
jgi:ATP-binding cassette subfamily B protein